MMTEVGLHRWLEHDESVLFSTNVSSETPSTTVNFWNYSK
jgi:hypothetical protein